MATTQLLATTRQEYQALHDSIEHAREVCTDPLKRPGLRHNAEEVQDVLSSLDQADLLSRTGALEAVEKQITLVNADMEKLRAEIDQIVQDVACATKVIGAVDGVLSASAKFLA